MHVNVSHWLKWWGIKCFYGRVQNICIMLFISGLVLQHAYSSSNSFKLTQLLFSYGTDPLSRCWGGPQYSAGHVCHRSVRCEWLSHFWGTLCNPGDIRKTKTGEAVMWCRHTDIHTWTQRGHLNLDCSKNDDPMITGQCVSHRELFKVKKRHTWHISCV